MDANNFKVDHPEQFPLATAGEYIAAPELNVTGVVSPDVSRQVPVPSLASGRVVEIDARLGDEVKKGQLLFKVRSTDIAGAFSDYRKAVKNEQLAQDPTGSRQAPVRQRRHRQERRSKSRRTPKTTPRSIWKRPPEHLRLLGSDPDHPTGIVEVYAPVSGVITDQQITNASGVQALTPPNPFTISDVSHVWIVCDVYENDLAQVHMGEYADIHLNAYPDRRSEGAHQQHRPDHGPESAHGESAAGSGESRPDALRDVRYRDFPRRDAGEARHRAGHGDSAPARPRLGLRAGRGRAISGAWKWPAATCFRAICRKLFPGIKPGPQVVANALVLQNTVEQ